MGIAIVKYKKEGRRKKEEGRRLTQPAF